MDYLFMFMAIYAFDDVQLRISSFLFVLWGHFPGTVA